MAKGVTNYLVTHPGPGLVPPELLHNADISDMQHLLLELLWLHFARSTRYMVCSSVVIIIMSSISYT